MGLEPTKMGLEARPDKGVLFRLSSRHRSNSQCLSSPPLLLLLEEELFESKGAFTDHDRRNRRNEIDHRLHHWFVQTV